MSPPKFDPSPFGGLEWTWGVKNGTSCNVDPTFLFDFYTHTIGLSCTIWPQYAKRQTPTRDRAIGIGRLYKTAHEHVVLNLRSLFWGFGITSQPSNIVLKCAPMTFSLISSRLTEIWRRDFLTPTCPHPPDLGG